MPLSLINPLTEASTIATNVVNNSAQTNYIAFPVATSDPTSNGWTVYKDTDTVLPVDGEGGSPVITLTRNTDTPLSSTGDFRLTKSSGASRRGEGISTDFIISPRHLSKVLQISFDYEVISGSSLATDDLRIYIIQEPASLNRVVIEPVGVSLQGTVSGTRLRHLATFQTHISITSYRLCIHVATTTNSAQTIDFNNFRVWESTQTIGSITTDWVSYIPTINDGGTLSNVNVYWRRVGGSVEIEGTVTLGTTGSGEFRFSLPSGLSILSGITDATKTLHYAGELQFERPSSPSYGPIRYKLWATSGHTYLRYSGTYATSLDGTGTNNPLITRGTSFLIESNGTIYVRASVPIQGWGSSVAMSSDSGDGRIVSGSYQGHTSKTYSIGDKIKFNTLLYDSHNIYNLSTGDITIPISGTYFFNLARIFTTGSSISFSFFKGANDTTIYALDASSSLGLNYGVQLDNLKAGDIISIRSNGSGTTIGTISGCIISWFRVNSGSQVIANNETTAMNAVKTTGSIPNGGVVTSWTSLPLDTHSSFNLTTGEYTIPSSGVYAIYGIVSENSPITGAAAIQIQSNATGSFVIQAGAGLYHTGGSIYHTPNAYVVKRCVAGEKIRLYSTYQPSTPNGPWYIMNFSISRVGI